MKTVQFVFRIALVALLVSVLTVSPADAQVRSDISIEFDDLAFGSPGSVREVAQVQVDDAFVGLICALTVHAENQSSVHIGNDLIVSTGTSQAVVVGVEDTPNGGTDQTYGMLMGDTIVVQIRFGQDGMSSLGFGLSFDCQQPPVNPTLGQQTVQGSTTTTTAPTTTAVPETLPPAPSTTAAPSTSTPPTTAPATTAPPTSAVVPATVAGAVTNGLPETPAAQPVVRAPAYTG